MLQVGLPPQPPRPTPQPLQVGPTYGPSFALTPGQANSNQFINYTTTSTGIELWQEVTVSLPNKFSTEGRDANQFCKSLLKQTEKFGWNKAQSDIVNVTANGQQTNIFTAYSQVPSTVIIYLPKDFNTI